VAVDFERASRAIAEFLLALGHDPEAEPELRGTPERVAQAFGADLLRGEGVDIPALVAEAVSPATGGADLVVVHDIRVATICPHHLMPALGEASVAYLPGAHLLGIGSLAKLVHAYAERLTLQEQIGQDVSRALMTHAGARGAACRLSLRHSCLSARGSREHAARVVSLARAGELATPERLPLLALAFGPGLPHESAEPDATP